eukprot:TRINITY_DN41086_c0_g1_i1.p2 TRINITY_DN41086_c0_g1~~TRINITY_DN41086_c0_g1_i1.p2  ORF type:complete len:159 (-),score=57.46 TRINITY_DN41086_c0_g1_i1:69-524(-)
MGGFGSKLPDVVPNEDQMKAIAAAVDDGLKTYLPAFEEAYKAHRAAKAADDEPKCLAAAKKVADKKVKLKELKGTIFDAVSPQMHDALRSVMDEQGAEQAEAYNKIPEKFKDKAVDKAIKVASDAAVEKALQVRGTQIYKGESTSEAGPSE